MAKLVMFLLCSVLACIAGQRITTIQLDGAQYFISRMNPYSPELNYFLAYQYCRSLGLQLASFETKEKVESMTTYLSNAGYSKYDFWTSGNRLGTGMFLWMSTGLPFNATFDYFENSADAVQTGLLDPVDHNSNTSPQRTARDSSSGLEKGCVILKAPSLKWSPEDCSAIKDFICEQTRCYYYNYGSIPVSSAQGRPLKATTHAPIFTTTPIPHLFTSTFATLAKKSEDRLQEISESSEASSPKLPETNDLPSGNNGLEESSKEEDQISEKNSVQDDLSQSAEAEPENAFGDEEPEEVESEEGRSFSEVSEDKQEENVEAEKEQVVESTEKPIVAAAVATEEEEKEEEKVEPAAPADEAPTVEQRLKQITQEIEKYGSVENADTADIGRQSFLSLSDLIRTLRPNDKNIPHIDSDYSNTMRVLGETSSFVTNNNNESKKIKNSGPDQEGNRSLF